MAASSFVFLAVRALHVLLAAAWLGATAFLTSFLLPALDDIGAADLRLMAALTRRRIHVFMASIGGLTVLSGVWLYWRFTGGFDHAASATMGARVFGAGGAAGIVALVIGGSVVGRTARKLADLAPRAASAPDGGTERADVGPRIAALKRRLSLWGKVVLILQGIATVCMAIGHYV